MGLDPESEIDPRLVSSRDDLIQFLVKLRDNYNFDPDAWENGDIDSYLEALIAFLIDAGDRISDMNRYAFIAQILYSASAYE